MRRAEMHFLHNYITNIAYSPQNPRAGTLDPKNFPDLFHLLISSDNILYSVLAASALHMILNDDLSNSGRLTGLFVSAIFSSDMAASIEIP